VKSISYFEKFADGFKACTFGDASYMKTDMCKFESLQKMKAEPS